MLSPVLHLKIATILHFSLTHTHIYMCVCFLISEVNRCKYIPSVNNNFGAVLAE